MAVQFSSRCYAKIALHCAKYPHCSVAGLLLGVSGGPPLDAVPLFHQCLHLAPMAEVALTQIDDMAQAVGLTIIGFYSASENFKDNTIEKAPGAKIADKIAEYYSSALFVIVDNRQFSMNLETSALKVAQNYDGKWRMKDAHNVIVHKNVLDCVSSLLKQGAYKNLIDYDNHLDDITLDWTNSIINEQVDQLMDMYE